MCKNSWNIENGCDGGQKDAFLRRAKIKKNTLHISQFFVWESKFMILLTFLGSTKKRKKDKNLDKKQDFF